MDWDWKKTLGTVAPTIATALGGPLAGLAVQAIGGIFGLGDNPTEDQLKTAMQGATPADFLALKKAEQDFLVRMEELGIERERLIYSDKDSARKREMEVKDKTPAILGLTCILLTVLMEGWVLLQGYPEQIPGEVIGRILGTWDAATMAVLYYYFGSSSGAARKDELLARK